MIVRRYSFRSPEITAAFGALLGELAQSGDVIALTGDLGAGKTCLTQGIAAGLGIVDEAITSPTYALINEHYGGRIPLYHMDAYRIQDASELGPIGFDEYLAHADGLLVIEWADNIITELPEDRLDIELSPSSIGADSRDAEIAALGMRSEALLSCATKNFAQSLIAL